MNKLTAALTALIASLVLSTMTASSFATTNSNSTQGGCYNGSTWQIVAQRTKTKVTLNITIKPVQPHSIWNINFSYIPNNTVQNFLAKADKNGKLTFKDTVYTTQPLTAFMWADFHTVTTCIASISI